VYVCEVLDDDDDDDDDVLLVIGRLCLCNMKCYICQQCHVAWHRNMTSITHHLDECVTSVLLCYEMLQLRDRRDVSDTRAHFTLQPAIHT